MLGKANDSHTTPSKRKPERRGACSWKKQAGASSCSYSAMQSNRSSTAPSKRKPRQTGGRSKKTERTCAPSSAADRGVLPVALLLDGLSLEKNGAHFFIFLLIVSVAALFGSALVRLLAAVAPPEKQQGAWQMGSPEIALSKVTAALFVLTAPLGSEASNLWYADASTKGLERGLTGHDCQGTRPVLIAHIVLCTYDHQQSPSVTCAHRGTRRSAALFSSQDKWAQASSVFHRELFKLAFG